MFDQKQGFYPTPPEVVSIMLDGLELKGDILDPSAGKGNILDVIDSRTYYSRSDLYAIEIDPNLRAILNDKGYNVIDSDFLQYDGSGYFDLIIMNPPFNNGAAHVLKAWDIAHGATIRALVNSESLSNTSTKDRARLKSIVDQYGWSKELGKVFLDAERRTAVSVTLIHLEDTREQETFRFDFEPERMNGRINFDDIGGDDLISADVFTAHEAYYQATLSAFKRLLEARQEVEYYLNPLLPEYGRGVGEITAAALEKGENPDAIYRVFMKDITRSAWKNLFQKTKMQNVVTENVRKELSDIEKRQGSMAFTARNMVDMFDSLFSRRDRIFIDCLLDAFDYFTYFYDGNRAYVDGFKTNNAYFIGKRVILPDIGTDNPFASISYSKRNKLEDIEKALCFLQGVKYEDIKHTSIIAVYEKEKHLGKKMNTAFFVTKLFKKGTMHLEWRSEDLRQRFNAVVAQERWGFLPEKIKKDFYHYE